LAAPFSILENNNVCCQVIAVNQQCASTAGEGCGAAIPKQATCPAQLGAPRFVSRESGKLTVTCDLLGGDGGSPITAYRFTYYDTNIVGGFSNSFTVT
jgi:hypothetical protein